MAGHALLVSTAHERFMEAACKEMEAFERHEREFLKQEREERAAQLKALAEASDNSKETSFH